MIMLDHPQVIKIGHRPAKKRAKQAEEHAQGEALRLALRRGQHQCPQEREDDWKKSPREGACLSSGG